MSNRVQGLSVLLLILLGTSAPLHARDVPDVMTVRVPDGGIQPQVLVDQRGIVHVIYLKGDPATADIFYVRSHDGGETFSEPLRVNSEPGSAIAIGTVRGAHLAVGKGGRIHVAWMGSRQASPNADHQKDDQWRRAGLQDSHRPPEGMHRAPMLYARSNDDGSRFEPQRNLMRFSAGLDGGGSVAADSFGNVYVAWHGVAPGEKGETNRRVWVTRSHDEGRTFSREQVAWDEPTGSCACCGMRAFADSRGTLYVLYRAAVEGRHRDMYLLVSTDGGKSFEGRPVHAWEINACPMSTAYLSEGASGVFAAWETRQQVFFSRISPGAVDFSSPSAGSGEEGNRKHPVIAANGRGEFVLAWTEGTGWKRGGSLAWQVYDEQGRPLRGGTGRVDGVPVWSLVAAFVRTNGDFVLIH